jgi:hypothetical protein
MVSHVQIILVTFWSENKRTNQQQQQQQQQ